MRAGGFPLQIDNSAACTQTLSAIFPKLAVVRGDMALNNVAVVLKGHAIGDLPALEVSPPARATVLLLLVLARPGAASHVVLFEKCVPSSFVLCTS